MTLVNIHCGDVFAGEGIGGVGDEQACLSVPCKYADQRDLFERDYSHLSDSTITCDDALKRDRDWLACDACVAAFR